MRAMLCAAIGAALFAVASPSSNAADANVTIDFDNVPPGFVTAVTADGGQGPFAVNGFNSISGGLALVADDPTGPGNVLTVGKLLSCGCSMIQIDLRCEGMPVQLQSLRIVGTTKKARVVYLDNGGNALPNAYGQNVSATGPSGSTIVTPPGSAGASVAGLLVYFDGAGAVDDVRFIGCGDDEEPPTPGMSLVKTSNKTSVKSGDDVEYSYTVSNTGSTTLINVVVTDDNGTPGDLGDDFVAGTISSLAPGASKTFKVKIKAPACAPGEGDAPSTLTWNILPNGDVEATLAQGRNVNDNTYGINSSAGWSGPNAHRFKDLVGSDKCEFRFTNGAGQVVIDFYLDYISQSALFPSGYGTLGVSGGDGGMVSGSAANIVSYDTSFSRTLNLPQFQTGYFIDSPVEPTPDWEYVNSYTVVIRAAAFGPSGFGGVTTPDIHNSPAMRPSTTPSTCEVTNVATARATAMDTGYAVTATDDATISVTSGGKAKKGKKKKHH
jgi:hypothetical protein